MSWASAPPLITAQLAVAYPDGIDVYFENVGGAVWDAVFPLLNPFARILVLGLIAQYNDGAEAPLGPDRLPRVMRDVLNKSLTIRGFIQREFADQRPEFYRQAAEWIAGGRLRYREDIVDGLENAPAAFIDLLKGRNFGKLIVRVGNVEQAGIGGSDWRSLQDCRYVAASTSPDPGSGGRMRSGSELKQGCVGIDQIALRQRHRRCAERAGLGADGAFADLWRVYPGQIDAMQGRLGAAGDLGAHL